MNYHKSELSKVNPDSTEFPTMIKVRNSKGETKWLDLNESSLRELLIWIDKYYPEAWKYVPELLNSNR